MKRIVLLLTIACGLAMCSDAKVSLKDWMLNGFLKNSKVVKEYSKVKKAKEKFTPAEKEGSAEETENEAQPLVYDEALQGISAEEFLIDIDDPKYEWSQSDNKLSRVVFNEDGLIIENKKPTFTTTVVELPVDVTKDFFVGVILAGPTLKNTNSLSVLFDYEDSRNYKCIRFNNKQYEYCVIKEGISSTVKNDLIKLKKDDISYVITLQREGDNLLHFKINDIEYALLKNVAINNPGFGIGLEGKCKTTLLKLLLYAPDTEYEEEVSTSDT